MYTHQKSRTSINTIHATIRKGIIDRPNPPFLCFADQLIKVHEQNFKILLRPKNPAIRKKKLMARRSGDSQAVHSSLALLQERFNQLQRTREMRQERELMRLISDAQERHAASSFSSNNNYYSSSATMHYLHQPSMLYDSELLMFHKQRPSSQLGLSLKPEYSLLNRPNFAEMEGAASPQETKSWLFGINLGLQTTSTSASKFGDSTTPDVDTSLRL